MSAGNIVALITVAAGLVLSGCIRQGDATSGDEVTGGNAARGRDLIYDYNCGSCHVIPGVAEANGSVGPSLSGVGSRTYIAGSLVNTPENLFEWIARPQEIQAGNAMPDLGVTKEQAIDIAAYLYTLH